jgi:hypothetical protein
MLDSGKPAGNRTWVKKPVVTTIETFERSLSQAAPPVALDLALQALWWAGKGDWDQAHQCVQRDEGNPRCDHVHAFLHRQEGDLGNAQYWYRRAQERLPTDSLAAEWKAISASLLATLPDAPAETAR